MSKGFSTVILAAGQGTRMKSSLPKVLHSLGGKAMIEYVLNTVLELGAERNILVLGFGRDTIQEFLRPHNYGKIEIAIQEQQLGSGHAVMQAVKALKNCGGDVLVLCADVPLIKIETLRELISEHKKQKNDVTVVTTEISPATGYGRIVRGAQREVIKIVEEKDATEEERLLTEINSGIYCFKAESLLKVLHKIKPDNVKKEYYLTDTLSLLKAEQGRIGTLFIADNEQVQGINDRGQLAQAGYRINQQIVTRLMVNGVTVFDPHSVWIDASVTIGQDTIIYPGTIIVGTCVIGSGCSLGPHAFIQNSSLSDEVEVRASFIYEAEIGRKVKIGPFAHIRPKTKVAQEAKIGNFVEIKKAVVGKGSKISHLTYVGDAVIGTQVNIGAGVITCNYDGVRKHETIIEDRVFVGSNTNLVAPVRIGQGAIIGAGSTITEDVPADSLALARSQQVNKEGWAAKRSQKLKIKHQK